MKTVRTMATAGAMAELQCDFLVTTEKGQELAGTLTLRGEEVSAQPRKGYEALLESVIDDTVVTSSEPRDVRVHGSKDAAVMIYRTTSREPLLGQEITEEWRIVETYVKRNGRWLLTARAESEIPNANRVPARIAPEILDEYVGEYQVSPGNVVKITREGDHLMEQGPDDPKPVADLPLSENSFFQPEQPGILTFTRSPGGKVDQYVLWIYDSTITGTKIK